MRLKSWGMGTSTLKSTRLQAPTACLPSSTMFFIPNQYSCSTFSGTTWDICYRLSMSSHTNEERTDKLIRGQIPSQDRASMCGLNEHFLICQAALHVPTRRP